MPVLKGELRPSWSRRTVVLDGRQVLKVSLGTGDRRLAVTRWDELHPLVQTAVREAERREAAARTAERDRVSPERLAPEAVRAMAGQVLHKVVADHDLTYIEPDHLNGTAQAIGKVLVLNGSDCPEPGHVRDTERAFRDILMMKVEMKVYRASAPGPAPKPSPPCVRCSPPPASRGSTVCTHSSPQPQL